MSSNNLAYLNQIAKYLKVTPGKLTIESNSVPVYNHENKTVKGFLNILLQYFKSSKLVGQTVEDKAEICQWVEYALIHASQCNNSQNTQQILSELDNILSTRTYFVSNSLTIADIVLYYVLYNTMENLSYLEKEKYLNVSRWFDNLQQDSNLRQKNSLVDFSTSFLSTVVPARH